MSRPIEPTPDVTGEDAERLQAELQTVCSPEESARRQAAARTFIGTQLGAAAVVEGDVQNLYGVGMRGRDVVVLLPARVMTRKNALVFAAFLVAVAEEEEGDFAAILERVRNT